MSEKVKQDYKWEAKIFVDFLFDSGFFVNNLSREGMDAAEGFLAWIFRSKVNEAIKSHDLLKSIKGRTRKKR